MHLMRLLPLEKNHKETKHTLTVAALQASHQVERITESLTQDNEINLSILKPGKHVAQLATNGQGEGGGRKVKIPFENHGSHIGNLSLALSFVTVSAEPATTS